MPEKVFSRTDALECCALPIDSTDPPRHLGDFAECPKHGRARVVAVNIATWEEKTDA